MCGNQPEEIKTKLNTVEEAINDFKDGKFVIVVDDEDRENEGDFIIAAEKVTEGANLASQLEKSGYFPPMMVQMIRSGENSGELDRMLTRASDMQDREVTSTITTLLALLEPLMLVFMAAIVLVIVIAVMLPIVNMNNLI